MSFLPNDYQIPSSGGRYFKLQPGENRLRILDSPAMGYEYWVVDASGKRSPVRRPMGHRFDREELEGSADAQAPKHFWAMPVWSYRDNAVMVWEATQKSVIKAIRDYVADDDWSNPREYDFVVTRSGEGMETEYAVKPKKPTDLPEAAAAAWLDVRASGFDLRELFDGGDPFQASEEILIEDIAVPE